MSRYGRDLTVYRPDLLSDATATRMLVSTARGRYGGRPVKRRRTVFVPSIGTFPRTSVFPAAGRVRISGNYGKYDRSKGSTAAPELKFIDTFLANAVVPQAGFLRPTVATDNVTPAVALAATGTLVQIAQGDQAYQRNGKNIVVKSISARLNVTLPETPDEASTADIYRIILVQDMQCNGAAPAVADVISYPGSQLNEESFNNLENNRRFRTIADIYRPINAGGGGINGITGTSVQVNHVLKLNKKCNIPISYSTSATTGALATIKSNNLFLLAISQKGVCLLAGTIRIRYQD